MDKIKFEKQVLFDLISCAEENQEIRILVNMIDRLWRNDQVELSEIDWPVLSKLVGDRKSLNDKARNAHP